MRRSRLVLLLIAGIGLTYFAVERGPLSSRAPGAAKDAVPAIPVLATRVKVEAKLNIAGLDFERASRLAATGSGSRQQLDTSQALVAQLEAAIKADQAMIDMAENQLNYTRIRSPIDGRAGTRIVDIGNIVRATDNAGIVIVNQLHPIFVNFALPADSLPQ